MSRPTRTRPSRSGASSPTSSSAVRSPSSRHAFTSKPGSSRIGLSWRGRGGRRSRGMKERSGSAGVMGACAEDRPEEGAEPRGDKRRVAKGKQRSTTEGNDASEDKGDEAWDEGKQQEARDLYERWAEEYFEIVDQLPMELHRTFALMRELEGRVQDRIALVASQTKAYRNARLAAGHPASGLGGPDSASGEEADNADAQSNVSGPVHAASPKSSPDWLGTKAEASMPMDTSSDADAEGEDDDLYQEAPSELGQQPPPLALHRGQEQLATTSTHASSHAGTTPLLDAAAPGHATRAARLSLLSSIARASSEAMRAADEKVGLAVTAYDRVDRQIRRLDADLQKSESSLLLGLRAGTEASRGLQDALGISNASEDVADSTSAALEALRQNRHASKVAVGSARKTREGAGASRRGRSAAHPSVSAPGQDLAAFGLLEAADHSLSSAFVGDMAIDPNEPKYCYCDQVSFGDMVACDNEDCPREWFHYHCVGLAQPPKGRWFCLFCAPPGFKGSGTFPPNAPCLPPGLQNSVAAASGRGTMAVRRGRGTRGGRGGRGGRGRGASGAAGGGGRKRGGF